ncbi:unnamed protein product [Rotaria sp. Silwood2]|nr:unnamed protein product [Rotaria sp. Silwood2]CAF4373436.1 unnamed protein product [Rotaria sp. Silwood2]
MMIICILFFLISCILTNSHYSLYHSNIRQISYRTFDCLYAYLIDGGKESGGRYIRNYHLIPYCRRPDDNDELEPVSYLSTENIAKTITFDELKKQGITSEQLLEWFAPIDVAEKYEMNNDSADIFHKCVPPWFGSMCQYKFQHDLSLSFGDIVQATFSLYSNIIANVTIGTCYRFLESCHRDSWPQCLDWREICDGKMDCISGEDEQWCDQLEMTKCSDNEYRCHYGGQCIPLNFYKDSRLSIDCLDGSDEQDHITDYSMLVNVHCTNIQTFRCQEHTGRYPLSFQCGHGQYLWFFDVPNLIASCSNNRDIALSRAILTSFNYISNISCREAFFCALYSNRTLHSVDRSVLLDNISEKFYSCIGSVDYGFHQYDKI